MSTTLPIVRSTRRTDYLATAGQVAFGLGVPVWDLQDVAVFTRLDSASDGAWSALVASGNWSAAFDPGANTVTVTFLAPPKPTSGSPAIWVRVESMRVQERTTDATRGGVMQSALVERDFDTIATVLQEVRRDVNDATNYSYIADAQAAADAAEASAANAAASAATAESWNTSCQGYTTQSQGYAAAASNSQFASANSASASSNSANAAAASATSATASKNAAAASANAAAASATAANVDRMEWKNAWLTGTLYQVNDVVGSGGSSYICNTAHTAGAGNVPPNASFWDLVASKGDPGSGGAGSGDVLGPASAVVGHVATFSNIDGKHIQDGGALATVATTGAYADLTGKPALATVATTGAYNDLSGKPAIPVVGTDAQAHSVILDSLAGITGVANSVLVWLTATTLGNLVTSAIGRTLMAVANAAAGRAAIGAEALGLMAAVTTLTSSANAAAADAGAVIELNSGSAITYTLQPNATTAIPVNSRIDVVQLGAGQATIVAGAGVTIRALSGGLKVAGQNGAISLYKRGTDDWVAIGGVP